ncbi:MAG TPA: DUF4236 domain-containing protein [Firmicutes bacterium]|jgi:tetratricopeptide (TPR) repeat protein|nr:DUF4236 domain-containing protein [Syntrophomonadaceae bacterium]HHV07477.1 DUF4236 domain-containing protein [Bacillota bacterium]
MGWRFRRSIRIGKGTRINISKSGVGMSVGGKVLRAGVGPRGAYRTFRIPGTGLYHMEHLGTGKERGSAKQHNHDVTTAAVSSLPPELAPKAKAVGCLAVVVSLILLFVWWPAGLLALGVSIYLRANTPSARARKCFLKAQKAQAKGEIEEAVSEYQQVLALVPDVPAVFYNLAYLYWEQGLLREAKEALETYLGFQPEDYSTKYSLAVLLRQQGDLDSALELLNELPPEVRNEVPVINARAGIYLKQNKPELALAVLETGPWRQKKNMDQVTMEYRYLMAQTLLAVGKNKRALTQLRRLFTQDPNYKDVAELITKLTSTSS